MSDDIWEVYAVRYAEHQRKAAENYIGGDPHDVLQPLDYFVWVIKNAKRTFLVDTGFDQPVGTKRGRTVVTPIDQGLKRLGIEPDKVEDIIISHMHYDHCGNTDMFPRARYHVQDKEMVFPNGAVLLPGTGTLVVAETWAARLTAFDVDTGGELGNKRVWAELPAGSTPDGLCVDAAGGEGVSHPGAAASGRAPTTAQFLRDRV